MPGDLVLLPTGATHRLSSDPRARCRRFDRRMKEEQMTAAGDLRLGTTGATTTFVCAAYNYDSELGQPLMSVLPDAMHVPADPVAGRDVSALVELLAHELGERHAGARSATARLIDLLLIASIRRWLGRLDQLEQPSWLAGLRDPLVGRVLEILHDRPSERWTLDLLAREVRDRHDRPRRRLHLRVRVQPRLRPAPRQASRPLPTTQPSRLTLARMCRNPSDKAGTPMQKDDIDRWLREYVAAWKAYDPERIAALFSEDVRYRYHPYDEPVRGRASLVASWLGEGETAGASTRDAPGTFDATYRTVAIDGDLVVATGATTYRPAPDADPNRVFDNCFVMRFDTSGRCCEFTEWYMERPNP